MILLHALLLGLLGAAVRAAITGRVLQVPELRHPWLVALGFVPQFFAFLLPATRGNLTTSAAAWALVLSQGVLLAFAWLNRGLPGFWLLGVGLALNLLVIVANGGLMPISPETVEALAPQAPAGAWQLGERLGGTKDLVLLKDATRLWWLSDRFLLPSWFPQRAAFSPGDTLVALGAAWFAWTLGTTKDLSTTWQEAT